MPGPLSSSPACILPHGGDALLPFQLDRSAVLPTLPPDQVSARSPSCCSLPPQPQRPRPHRRLHAVPPAPQLSCMPADAHADAWRPENSRRAATSLRPTPLVSVQAWGRYHTIAAAVTCVWAAAERASAGPPCGWAPRRRCRLHPCTTQPLCLPASHRAAEVLPVKSGMSGDVTKRGGRWESDFIWNKVRGPGPGWGDGELRPCWRLPLGHHVDDSSSKSTATPHPTHSPPS